MSTNREILMKFITGQVEKARQDVSLQGYKDDSPYRNNPSNTIYGSPEGTSITMQGVSTPLVGVDEFGNTQKMFPGQQYQYPGSRVTETPMAKYGGLLNKTIKCSNCGWSWKAADGGNDVTTCHKCGNENTIMQSGGEQKPGEKDFQNVKDWYNAYIQSPLYKENLQKSGYENPDELITERQASVNRAKYELRENRLGTFYRGATNKIYNAPKKDAEVWSKEYPSVLPNDTVLAHEFGHASLDKGKSSFGSTTPNWNKHDYDQLTSRNKNPKMSRGADENYADQKALQYEAAKLGIYKPGHEEFTKEHLDKLPIDIKDRALQNYSEEDLIWLMNNIAQTDDQFQLPIAQEAGEIQKNVEPDSSIEQTSNHEQIKLSTEQPVDEIAKQDREKLFNQHVNDNDRSTTLFHEEWMNSPQYNKLLTESTKENKSFDLYNDQRNDNLEELRGVKINTSVDEFQDGVRAYFRPIDRTINFPFNSTDPSSNDQVRSTLAHEKSHFIDNMFDPGQQKFSLNNKILRKEFKNRDDDRTYAIPQKDADLINSLKVPKTDSNAYKYDYFTDDTEVRSRLNQVRENLFNSGNKEFLNRDLNDKDLKPLYDNIEYEEYQYLQDLKDHFGEEGTLKLLNSVSQNDNNTNNQMPIAKRGGSWFGNADEMSVSNKYDIGGTTGNTVAEQYTKITGKPWSTARAQGLTDGTAKQNLALIERLKQQSQPVETPVVVEVANSSDKYNHTKEMAQRVVQIAEERIKNGNYIDVPADLVEAAKELNESANSCIGGVCDVLKEAGVMKNVDWSNTHFSEHAKEYGFTANQGWGVKGIDNLEPGDVLQHNNHLNKQGNYYPGHSQIYLGKNSNGKLRFFDNFWKTERTYFVDDVEKLLDKARKKTELSATIYKVNPYDDSNPLGLNAEEKKNFDDKQDFIKKESSSKASYKWGMSPTAKNYNSTTQRVMDSFIAFANDNDKINDLVKKTGKSKEEIHDSLLNVFGELGTENNWTTSKGKGLGSRLENIAESILTAVGGGKSLSVGPGQIKYSELQKEADAAKLAGTKSLKEQFNITSPNDLYDLDKVLPLMAAMDLRDKQVLENWGENNTLSQKLFGWTRPEIDNGGGPGITTGGFKASQLTSETGNSILDNGVGRYSPYLRNQYSSIANNAVTTGQYDWIPFNEETERNFTEGYLTKSGEDEMKMKYERDPGSYPFKVEQNWRDNLNREIIPNEDGNIELSEIVIKGKKKKR